MINYAAITVVINVNEELVHDLMLSCFLYSPHCEVHGLSLVSIITQPTHATQFNANARNAVDANADAPDANASANARNATHASNIRNTVDANARTQRS